MNTDKKTLTLHRYTNRFLKLNILVLCFLLLLVLTASGVWAQIASSLIVAPSRQEITVEPGEKTGVMIKFLNQGDVPVSGLLKVADFIVEDKEGSPAFVEGPTQLSPRFAAASWVSLPYDRITIAPKDKVAINAKIQVPENARPGGRYLAVYFEPGGTTGKATGALKEAATPVSTRIAGLVYLRVAGPVREDARVVQFAAPRFSEYGPITFTTEILNSGDYHIRPKGTIALINMLGKEVAREKLKEQNIFPDASRLYENKLGQKWMFGKYKAELTASYGETGKALTATIFFWVFPWKVVSAVVLAVIIIVLLAVTFYRRIRCRQEELETRLAEEKKELEELKEKLEKKSE